MKFGASAVAALVVASESLASARVLRGDARGDASVLRVDGFAGEDVAKCHMKIHRRKMFKGRVQNSEEVVDKDGYWLVGCEKDTMYAAPPKNVSVIHYKDEVPKEDREGVTPTKCFNFCRSKPGMSFFGLARGRDCYCTPYFENEAGDDTLCDAVCEGDNTLMCGSMTKSSIYEMHACGAEAVAERLNEHAKQTEKDANALRALAYESLATSEQMQKSGGDFYELFALGGDAAAARLLQKAKANAGKLQHAANDAIKIADAENETMTTVLAIGSPPSKEEAKKMFSQERKVKQFAARVGQEAKSLNTTFKQYVTKFSSDKLEGKASTQYYSVLYFTKEKASIDNATTCTGDVIGEPRLVESETGCALACDAEGQTCAGYTIFKDLCFLLSNFKEATFYTKCKGDEEPYPKCVAKFSEFADTTLQPDGAGKCKQCLKKLTQRDICYKGESSGDQGQGQGQGGQGQGGQGQGR